ncbi:type VI secretion system lipoprotein TssJ [Rubrivivax gelatinosus]|uniref:Putative lipoprotein n=1 Tax=Rubrivivax gelatinosus (strain NBRC 100245 / IL144) TaxID=983917 RepID=I0HSD0_RUBGI|nr:type VI secretion system lipoprotein TssJ [Rubrivivax gelatinosus]BAL95917.1 putative lipoprotein [Rubrivivax gelatinosus IL144]
MSTLKALALRASFSGAVLLTGCASSQGVLALDKPLEWLGMKKPELPPAAVIPLERKVTLRLHAGDRLNTDSGGRSLSIVVRIYKLKDVDSFMASPLAAFQDDKAEKAAFGESLIAVREVVLTPGQKYEVVETLAPSVSNLAVVAQFRAPADGRWRFAFSAQAAEKTGITLGLHGCAMSVATGEPVNTAPELLRLAGVHCR